MLLLFFITSTAQAASLAPLCTPTAQLEASVNYCDQNSAFVAPAQTCLDNYKTLVASKDVEIEKNFAILQKTANEQAQNGDMATNQKLLDSTLATLNDLIARGYRTFDEVSDYQNDLVLPLYSAYPEDFSVDPHSAQGHDLFRSKECYGEPMEDLDTVKHQLEPMIRQLEKTYEKAQSLQALTASRKTNLNSVGDANAAANSGNAAKDLSHIKGQSKKDNGTITGSDKAIQDDKDSDAFIGTTAPAAPATH